MNFVKTGEKKQGEKIYVGDLFNGTRGHFDLHRLIFCGDFGHLSGVANQYWYGRRDHAIPGGEHLIFDYRHISHPQSVNWQI